MAPATIPAAILTRFLDALASTPPRTPLSLHDLRLMAGATEEQARTLADWAIRMDVQYLTRDGVNWRRTICPVTSA